MIKSYTNTLIRVSCMNISINGITKSTTSEFIRFIIIRRKILGWRNMSMTYEKNTYLLVGFIMKMNTIYFASFMKCDLLGYK